MNSNCILPLADFPYFNTNLHPEIWIIFIVFAFVAIVILNGTRYARRRDELWHETARIALEKGQPIPAAMENPELYSPNSLRGRRGRGDFRRGLILLAVGAGIFFAQWESGHRSLGYGAIPFFIGIALLINAAISSQRGPSQDPSRNPSLPKT